MNKATLVSFSVSFTLLVIVTIISHFSFERMKEYAISIDEAQSVITAYENLSNHLKSAEVYTDTYTNQPEQGFYRLYKQEAQKVPGDILRIKALVKNDEKKLEHINGISLLVHYQIDALLSKNLSEIIQSGESWRLPILFQIHTRITTAVDNEVTLINRQKAELEESTRLTSVLIPVFSVAAVVLILWAFFSNFVLSRKSKWLEGFLESVLNTSQNGIVHYRAVRTNGKITDFKVEFANAAIESLIGLKPANITGKRLTQLPSYVRRGELFSRYIDVVETGAMQEFETFYERGETKKWFYVMLVKLGDGITATFHNLTRLKQYEEDLKNNIRQLQHSNTDLEQYAYVASHDLQEPLRKIRTFGSLLQDTYANRFDEKGRSYLEKIISSSERMSRLITDILNFSSLRPEESFPKTNLTFILDNVLQDLELAIFQKQAVINYGNLPALQASALQMSQLFHNLIINALKFSKDGIKPVIEIHSRMLTPSEIGAHSGNTAIPYCEITVADNGVGFNQKYAEQVFGLFKRLGNKEDSLPGSGIGLALCRKIVANHNGEIFVKSNEGEGTVFHIILPLKQA